MSALPCPNRCAEIRGQMDATDASGRLDAWLTVGGCPVLTFEPAGPLYLVELCAGDEVLSAWTVGQPAPLMALAGQLQLRAAAQRMLVIDQMLPAWRWREGSDGCGSII